MTTRVTLYATVFLGAANLNPLAGAIPAPGPGGGASQKAIPWKEVAAAAGAQHSGEGLKVTLTDEGARLYCAFQRLDALGTREGLWLSSTVPDQSNDRFRVKAVAVGREHGPGRTSEERSTALPATGEVLVVGQTVRFTRPGLVEEYTVSMEGVQQDFLVLENPGGESVPAGRFASSLLRLTDAELRVELAVTGAQVNQTAYGAQLVLEQSGRKIAYSRLKATDARGKELPARMEVVDKSEIRDLKSVMRLAVVVDDAEAIYPVRIDPTFSDPNWVSVGGIPGANGFVLAALVDDSGNLYIGGSFTEVGDVLANNIAKWDGSAWSALGSGVGSGEVLSLAVSGSNVYAGGTFTTAGGSPASYIAKWDGSAWNALGSYSRLDWYVRGPLPTGVYALAISGNDVYAAGVFRFFTPGGTMANFIAKWDGSIWSTLDSGMDYPVSALALLGSDLYAAGGFATAGNITVNGLAKWDGSAWNVVGSGVNVGGVGVLAVSGNDLYAGGCFTMKGAIAATNIAKWDGSNWTTLGSGVNDCVRTLAVSGSNVYVAATDYVAKWDGNSWSQLGSAVGGGFGNPPPAVWGLAASGSNVFAVGTFTTTDSGAANYIAKWNGSAWSAMGSGLGGVVFAFVSSLAVAGKDVFAGGTFMVPGGLESSNVAKWNGSGWSALGSGLLGDSTSVSSLVASGNDLYVGGNFTNAGGITANYIAKWDGSSWSALDSGLGAGNGNPPVLSLAVSGSNLYAGGWFTTAGGIPANHIAKWDGHAWSGLGSGVYSAPDALVASGSDLYASGYFTNGGGVAVYQVAKWDGSAWSPLGSGMSGTYGASAVYALAVSGRNLYAGGYFMTAGGSPATNIAKWDGTAWSALGAGMNSSVYALAVLGSDVYAGGYFTTADNSPANYIAKWNGNSWSALGSGMGGGLGANPANVYALVLSGNELYAGGAFTTAGGKVSAYVAKALIGPPPFYFVSTNSSLAFSNGQFHFTLVGPAGSNAVVYASTNLQSWVPLVTNPLVGGSLNFTDALATNFTRRFYRALLQP
jgi:hypothetical protein